MPAARPAGVPRQEVTDRALHDPSVNLRNVAAALKQSGPMTRARLAADTGLTAPTVSRAVQTLIGVGAARTAGAARPTELGGRPGEVVDFDPTVCSLAAVMFRRDTIDVVVSDARGTPVAHGAVPRLAEVSALVDAVAVEVARLLAGVPGSGPLAAATGLVPGAIDRHSGACIAFDPLGWRDVPIQAMLSRRLQVPVKVLNPAAAAAVGVASRVDPHRSTSAAGTRGAGGTAHDRVAEPRDLVFVVFDRGVGVAIISDGRLVQGANGAVSELSHCYFPGSTARCACGRIGCLETVTSGDWIATETTRIRPDLPVDRMTLRELEAVGDPDVNRLLVDASDNLATGVSWVVNLVDPQLVVLGGTDYAAGSAFFLDTFRAALERRRSAHSTTRIQVTLADGGADVDGALQVASELLPPLLRAARTYVPQSDDPLGTGSASTGSDEVVAPGSS